MPSVDIQIWLEDKHAMFTKEVQERTLGGSGNTERVIKALEETIRDVGKYLLPEGQQFVLFVDKGEQRITATEAMQHPGRRNRDK